jgi:aryl-alcohol dehydrogenase-like predicted oxidoreductase
VIATKIGYDFVHHGNERRGQREIPQDFSQAAMVRATESALKRLKTNRIDLLQLHNIRMEQVSDDTVWETLEKLRERGLVRYYGIALGPAIGCNRVWEGCDVPDPGPTFLRNAGRALHGRNQVFRRTITEAIVLAPGCSTVSEKWNNSASWKGRTEPWAKRLCFGC